VTVTNRSKATTFHVRGATAPGKLLLRFRMDPGMRGAIVIDGPFLYLRAPAGMLHGKVQWLRRRIADINPNSAELRNIHSMTPAALLDVFATTRMRPTGDVGVFEGRLPYDEPVVRRVIRSLAGDVEFRRLGAMALVGEDGRVRRLRISGLTADKSVQLDVLAYFYAVDKPVQIAAPSQDTFLDLKQQRLTS
jgi:hypothetical protein